ncbi:MAG: DUF4352 domain-containing protein [Paenibacillaceae bacterium]|nr:DUF4352 domain-containing protein [Paenibacillaceae bacterium]
MKMGKEKPTTKTCKYCRTEIPYNAKVCPQCRKKQGPGGCLIAVIAFIALGVLGSCLGALGNNKDAANSKPKTENVSSEETTKDSSKELIAFGSEGQSDDLVLKINDIGATEEIKENQFLSYKPDSGKYALVNITIKNTGKKAVSLTNGYFKLVTADEAEYKPTILVGLDNKYITFETINPGLDVTGYLVFEVPNDLEVSDTTLKFSGTGLFTSSTIFSLKK